MSVGALYVHVPFCVRKCAYCDFASAATPAGDPCMAAYVDERVNELRALAAGGQLLQVRTAYVGGGTPTMLGARLVSRLVGEIRAACPHIVELTCEANPDSLSDEVLRALEEAGATRVSIGVQSLDDAELGALGRVHTAQQAKERVRAAIGAGLDVSVDLMCAIPHQTERSWDATLLGVLSLGVGHVSVYPLAIEQGTPFHALYANADTPWNDEDVQAARMERAEDVLVAAGYGRYEVASYARPGKECAHNIAYWTGVSYLGLGPGAASMLGLTDGSRLRFVEPFSQVEELSAREALAEDLMLGMRLTRGVDGTLLERARAAFGRELDQTLAKVVDQGLASWQGARLAPTHDGWLLGNELYGALWDLA